MAVRAFVIAIEDYSRGNFLPNLKGCNRDAETFIQWLLDNKIKDVKPESISDFIRCCAGKDVTNGKDLKWRTSGTTRGEIIAELARCLNDWANKSDEFYFYYSGHGFSYSTSPWEKSVDVLVGSDFTDLATGGGACLQLSEIKIKLGKSLGPKHHYYFIDACRNQIKSDAISPATTGLGFSASELGTPSIYKLFSTAEGEVSKTTSGFTPLLVKGLSGSGRSKGLRSGRMYVIFDLLCAYMKKNLQPSGQDVDCDREGSGEGFVLELKPIPQSKCEISVANAKAADNFTLTLSDIKGLQKQHQFNGDSFEVSLFPDDYFLDVKHPSAAVVQKAPPVEEPVDLYDACVVHFELRQPPAADSAEMPFRRGMKGGGGGSRTGSAGRKKTAGGSFRGRAMKGGEGWSRTRSDRVKAARKRGAGIGFGSAIRDAIGVILPGSRKKPARPRSMTGSLDLKAAPTPHTEIELLNLKTGDVSRRAGAFKEEVPAGVYLVKLRERGITVSQHELTIKPGDKTTFKLLDRPTDRVRETILKTVKADDVSGAAVFSERTLGPLASQDLGLWLSLFGAARILGESGEFQKLQRLPLETFDDVKKNEATVYILGGFEKSEGSVGIGLSSGPEVEWEVLREVKGLYRIYERRFPATPGSHLLSLKIPGQEPLTFASYSLPNRATLVVFAEDKEGRLAFHQFLLPISHLSKYLEPAVRSYLGSNMLSAVRTIALAHNQFARSRSVQEQMQTSDIGVWHDLLNGKWLDPVMALFAAYDVLRHKPRAEAKETLRLVGRNLRKYFEGLPDVEAIAKLLGEEWKVPSTAPLLLDGVLAFDDVQEKQTLPLSIDKLVYKGPWTTWRGAVNDFDPPAKRGRGKTQSTPGQGLKRSRKTAAKGEKKKAAKRKLLLT